MDEFKTAEMEEEAKLKGKYPVLTRPGPQLLQKRLQKGQKYFDSGDYNMAKAASKNCKTRLPVSTLSQPPSASPPPPPPPTGDTIPTPECLPTRKTSIHVQICPGQRSVKINPLTGPFHISNYEAHCLLVKQGNMSSHIVNLEYIVEM